MNGLDSNGSAYSNGTSHHRTSYNTSTTNGVNGATNSTRTNHTVYGGGSTASVMNSTSPVDVNTNSIPISAANVSANAPAHPIGLPPTAPKTTHDSSSGRRSSNSTHSYTAPLSAETPLFTNGTTSPYEPLWASTDDEPVQDAEDEAGTVIVSPSSGRTYSYAPYTPAPSPATTPSSANSSAAREHRLNGFGTPSASSISNALHNTVINSPATSTTTTYTSNTTLAPTTNGVSGGATTTTIASAISKPLASPSHEGLTNTNSVSSSPLPPDDEEEEERYLYRKTPSMIHYPTKYMIHPQSAKDNGKLTVVLDLDETVVHCMRWPGPVSKRPYIDELFAFLAEHCETIVWTAGIRVYAQAVIRDIDKNRIITHCVYRHAKWFEDQDYTKDLSLLGRDMNKTVIIENTPDCVSKNIYNGVIVPDYVGPNARDKTLLSIRALLQEMVVAVKKGSTVPQYIEQTGLLELRNATNYKGDTIPCYCLNYEPPPTPYL
eukprot:TRINITY_DN49134_c0_g1_i1.p1 TRINITY_DN49134_c0_g1~~TRINITY_DN49134_c0_g1_i1.p1  ORF type:complete len:537 (-),score=3.23 TRINITY_DN49134_c0_g1_i1:38-1510(-)